MTTNDSAVRNYQKRIIADLTAATRTVPIHKTGEYKEVYVFKFGEEDKRGYTKSLRVMFEENVGVYVASGNYHEVYGFYSDGSEASYTNLTADIVVVSIKVILGLV